jgi:hypothetical protein
MEAVARLSSEERFSIGAAVLAHVALAMGLAWVAKRDAPVLAPPERIAVSLATDVSLESTAPDPSAEPALSAAPEIAPLPEPPQEAVVTPPPRRPVERPVPPRPRETTTPRQTTDRSRPTPTPTSRQTTRPTPTPTSSATRPPRGATLGENFLEGASDQRGNAGSPAATFGAAERAALSSAITRELRPHWTAPSGVDVEQLVTVVAWQLNQDGSLRGQPRCLTQRGITESNRPQASLHCERAIRAVQLAAPFSSLPQQFYSRWDDLEWDFDRRL